MIKKDSSKRTLKFLIGLFKISPILGIVMILTQVAYAVFTATIAPIFISRLLTSIANGSATLSNSSWLLLFYAGSLFIGSVVMIRITIAMAFIVETKMQSITALKVFSHLTSKSLGFHANKMSGSMMADASRLNTSIERFWDTLIFNVIPVITTVFSVCIALGFILWQYAIILGLLSILIILIIVRSQISIAPVSRNVAEKSSAMNGHFADVISNISAVKAFAEEKAELQKFNLLVNDWKKASFKERSRK